MITVSGHHLGLGMREPLASDYSVVTGTPLHVAILSDQTSLRSALDFGSGCCQCR